MRLSGIATVSQRLYLSKRSRTRYRVRLASIERRPESEGAAQVRLQALTAFACEADSWRFRRGVLAHEFGEGPKARNG
ncbi:MAG: hypothetical protein ACI957_004308 [Verrucomicrobiales bacterium]|jgi:hypothetical protein